MTNPTPNGHLSLAGLTIALGGRPFRLEYLPAIGEPDRRADAMLTTIAVLHMEHENGTHRITYQLGEPQLSLDAFEFKKEIGDVVTRQLDDCAYPDRGRNEIKAFEQYARELTGAPT